MMSNDSPSIPTTRSESYFQGEKICSTLVVPCVIRTWENGIGCPIFWASCKMLISRFFLLMCHQTTIYHLKRWVLDCLEFEMLYLKLAKWWEVLWKVQQSEKQSDIENSSSRVYWMDLSMYKVQKPRKQARQMTSRCSAWRVCSPS